jgi:hypothetical protein
LRLCPGWEQRGCQAKTQHTAQYTAHDQMAQAGQLIVAMAMDGGFHALMADL